MSTILDWAVPEGRAVALAAGVACAVACGPADPSSPPPSEAAAPFAMARTLRVVSLSASASRLLLALGAGDQIAAVDAGSSRLPELSGLPVVDLARARDLDPDVILWPGAPESEAPLAEAARASGQEVVVFEPHSLEEAFALSRELGARLVGAPRAHSFELALTRQLATIGGSSFGRPRPRVAAVIDPEPLELAGGHSFVTDLIEIAGGYSVTHGGEELEIEIGTEQLKTFAPDLLLVVSQEEMLERERAAVQRALPAGYRVAFFAFDPERVWTQETVEAARRLRAVIEPLSREMEQTAREAG
jgi:ABC-type Fe3+-hydroxamate transport system substrate-binding protein